MFMSGVRGHLMNRSGIATKLTTNADRAIFQWARARAGCFADLKFEAQPRRSGTRPAGLRRFNIDVETLARERS